MIGAAVAVHRIVGRRLGRWCSDTLDHIQLEEMSLFGGINEAFPPRAKNEAAVELQLMVQLSDDSFVLLHGLIVELRGLIERGLEILDLVSEPVEQVVTFTEVSRP